MVEGTSGLYSWGTEGQCHPSYAGLWTPDELTPCRSGKSSIAGVVFQKTPPSETLFTGPTTEPTPSGMQ